MEHNKETAGFNDCKTPQGAQIIRDLFHKCGKSRVHLTSVTNLQQMEARPCGMRPPKFDSPPGGAMIEWTGGSLLFGSSSGR